jgi:hypothetical protein
MLEGGVSDPKSPANLLTDKSYVAFVTAFNFAEYGEDTTTRTPAMEPAVGKFLRQTLEEDAGSQDEGVRLALYFDRKAAGLTSPFSILADPALLKVVFTALNLPATTSLLDIDRQASLISARLDIDDLKQPEKRSEFLKRFTILWEVANPATGSPAPAILIGQPARAGIGNDVLASLQNLKLGGT